MILSTIGAALAIFCATDGHGHFRRRDYRLPTQKGLHSSSQLSIEYVTKWRMHENVRSAVNVENGVNDETFETARLSSSSASSAPVR